MEFCDNFVNNFLRIRKSHNLSAPTMATLLNFKSSTSITNFEKGRAVLSINTVHDICNLFSVTTDWLLGRSDEPYTEESVALAERILLEEIKVADKRNILSIEKFMSPYYQSVEFRKEHYSLPIRANIVFLTYVSQLSYIKDINRIRDIKETANPIKKLALEVLKDDSNDEKATTAQIIYSGLLSQMIQKKITVPIFDLTKEIA
ncbi:MAG: hypothetical protein IJC05_00260 [Phascolarctobacterium sp.]|nr:hypothetical protein [Phascolarctobacterium sp.]